MRKSFELEKKIYLLGEYQIMMVDGNVFHVSNKSILFAQKHKIMYLCLSIHFRHLLWSMVVEIFGALKQSYKTLLAENKIRSKTYNINKPNFISLIQQAKGYYYSKYTTSIASYKTYSI